MGGGCQIKAAEGREARELSLLHGLRRVRWKARPEGRDESGKYRDGWWTSETKQWLEQGSRGSELEVSR